MIFVSASKHFQTSASRIHEAKIIAGSFHQRSPENTQKRPSCISSCRFIPHRQQYSKSECAECACRYANFMHISLGFVVSFEKTYSLNISVSQCMQSLALTVQYGTDENQFAYVSKKQFYNQWRRLHFEEQHWQETSAWSCACLLACCLGYVNN